MTKEKFATDLKVGDKVCIQGGTTRTVAFVEISPTGKSVFYKWENDNYKMHLSVNRKVSVLC